MAAFPEECSSLLIKFPVNEGQKKQFRYLLRNDNLSLIAKKLSTLHKEVA